jgi:hypothetical protein
MCLGRIVERSACSTSRLQVYTPVSILKYNDATTSAHITTSRQPQHPHKTQVTHPQEHSNNKCSHQNIQATTTPTQHTSNTPTRTRRAKTCTRAVRALPSTPALKKKRPILPSPEGTRDSRRRQRGTTPCPRTFPWTYPWTLPWTSTDVSMDVHGRFHGRPRTSLDVWDSSKGAQDAQRHGPANDQALDGRSRRDVWGQASSRGVLAAHTGCSSA